MVMSPSQSVSVVIAHHGLGGHLLECLRAHLAELEEDDECVAVIAGAPSGDLGEEFVRRGLAASVTDDDECAVGFQGVLPTNSPTNSPTNRALSP